MPRHSRAAGSGAGRRLSAVQPRRRLDPRGFPCAARRAARSGRRRQAVDRPLSGRGSGPHRHLQLKVGFNKVFGYYLEITNTHGDKIPDDYIRKQTVKNAERYITPELKEYEEKVLSADERSKELEHRTVRRTARGDGRRRGALASHGRGAGPIGRAGGPGDTGPAARLLPAARRRRAGAARSSTAGIRCSTC